MTTERLRMVEAAKLVSPKSGPPVNEATVRRWSTRGVLNAGGQRIFLRTERIGRRMYTTQHWLEVFVACCSEAEPPRTEKPIRIARDRGVLAELRELGMKI